MAASLSVTVIDGAPGNSITIPGSGLTPGSNAKVTLDSQGVSAIPNLSPAVITLPATFDTGGANVKVTIPDGVMDGTLTVTANDNTTATCALRAVSQYVQAYEYVGEGEDVSQLQTVIANIGVTELDVLMRRASATLDTFMGDSIRLLQKVEKHRYKPNPLGPPRIFPWRTKGRRCPIVSLDQFTFVSAQNLSTVFNVNDMYVNPDLNYIEVLAYAVGAYALLGQLQNVGYSANVIELSYTSGYPLAKYPQAVRDATIMTVTAFLNRRRRQSMGMGPFEKYADKISVDSSSMKIPPEAKAMLRPYVVMALS